MYLEHVLNGTAPADLKDQEVNEPVWATEQLLQSTAQVNNDDTNIHEYHEQNPLRTNSGILDFLTHVAEDISEWIENETEHGPGHNYPRYGSRRPSYVETKVRPAYSWRAVTFNTDNFEGAFKIVEKREDRQRVIITNWGPGILFLSADSAGLNNTPRINQIQVAVNGSREFRHCDEIWAVGAVAGTPQVVDVQDEYGCEY